MLLGDTMSSERRAVRPGLELPHRFYFLENLGSIRQVSIATILEADSYLNLWIASRKRFREPVDLIREVLNFSNVQHSQS